MSALTFSFENSPVNVIVKDGDPWFIASQVTKAIHLTNPSVALKSLRSVEKAKVTIDGRETNIVSESGLYTLILRSQDAIKEGTPAFNFRVKVTDEILPAIRKTGRYESQPPEFISEAQQREIQRAVGRKAAPSRSFAAVYRALKDHFQIPRYTCLLAKDFDAAIAFINALDVATLEPPQPKEPPMILPTDPKPAPQLSDEDMKSLLIFVFMVRYFFADAFNKFYALLKCTNSPLAGQCWDAFHEVNWFRIIDVLAANGHDINDLPSFQRWKARHAA